MKLAQYILDNESFKDNRSFQKEIWDKTWSQFPFEQLKSQLFINPVYWRLKELIKPKDRILEAGCGYGQWVFRLNEDGFNITGVDFAPKTITKLKKAFKNLKFILADVEDLPFKDKTFDVYLSFGVIEHFEKGPQKVLREANRVLKKGGLLYLTVPYLNVFRFIRYFRSKENGEFYQYLYSRGEIVNHVKKAGFSIEKVNHLDFINALKRDFPIFFNLVEKKIKSQKSSPIRVFSQDRPKHSLGQVEKPNFFWQKLLYKLDSYIILIEAYKD